MRATSASSLIAVATASIFRLGFGLAFASACQGTGGADAGQDAGPFDFSAIEGELFGNSAQGEVDGLLVQYKGATVYERYANGFTGDQPHHLWSVSKSVLGALVGLAINDGLMTLTDSVCKYTAEPADAGDPEVCQVTIQELLQMTSGIAWTESGGSNPYGSEIPMLYGAPNDMGAYYESLPSAAPPGTTWDYSSGSALLLARSLRIALGSTDVRAYAAEKLFGPAGITTAVMEEDRSGTVVGSSWIFMSPRDLARFAQVFAADGQGPSGQILPASWVSFVSQPGPSPQYGAGWWLPGTTVPEVYEGTILAEGIFYQAAIVAPNAELVIVLIANGRTIDIDDLKLGSMVGAALGLATDQDTNQLISPNPSASVTFDGGPSSGFLFEGAGFAAQEGCSCRFVVQQSDTYCTAYASPPISVTGVAITVDVDDTGKTVTATASYGSQTATRVSAYATGAGCTLTAP